MERMCLQTSGGTSCPKVGQPLWSNRILATLSIDVLTASIFNLTQRSIVKATGLVVQQHLVVGYKVCIRTSYMQLLLPSAFYCQPYKM